MLHGAKVDAERSSSGSTQQQHRRQAQQASIVATSVAQVRAPFCTAEGVPEEKKREEGGGRQQVNV